MKKIILIVSLVFISSLMIQAQENEVIVKKDKKENKINVRVKTDGKAVVFIDGKIYDSDILSLLDHDKIESIDILRGQQAIDLYSHSNVILVKTRRDPQNDSILFDEKSKIVIKDDNNKKKINTVFRTEEGNARLPVIIVDGEVKDETYFKEISPNDIYKISVYKDEKSKKKYKAEYGVIVITTKEKAEKDKKKKKK